MENKTKFSIEIHRNGKHNDSIIRMITNHNEGQAELNYGLIRGYVAARFCEFPTIMPNVELNENVGQHILEILENEKPTLTIKEGKVIADEAPTIFLQEKES